MFRTMVFSAFGAALAVCLAVSALQFVTTQPLILHAEEFEGGAGQNVPSRDFPRQVSTSPQGGGSTEIQVQNDAGEHVHAEEAWAPADGLERVGYTVLANLVMAFAVSLMLLGGMSLKGDPIDGRRGLLWGVAGFAASAFLPALVLPPELPGASASDIGARQLWWLGTAAASAAGLALIAFARNWWLKAVGMALLVVPHAVGAPRSPSHEVGYTSALAGEFVVASLLVSALLWSLTGLASGWLYQRLSRSG